MDENEKKLLKGIQKGNHFIFQKIFELYYDRLILYANSYLESKEVAEDIVQDLMIHLWEKRKEIEITTSLSSYLFRAVHNKCIQYLRHLKVASKYIERHKLKIKEAEILYYTSQDFNFSELKLNEISNIITETFNELSVKTKEIFNLSRKHFYSNDKISKKLGVSIKTVEYHITKALRIFRHALKDYFLIFIFMKIF